MKLLIMITMIHTHMARAVRQAPPCQPLLARDDAAMPCHVYNIPSTTLRQTPHTLIQTKDVPLKYAFPSQMPPPAPCGIRRPSGGW